MNRQRIIRVGAIIAVAGITGFVMQSQSRKQSAPLLATVDPATTPTTTAGDQPAPAVAAVPGSAPMDQVAVPATTSTALPLAAETLAAPPAANADGPDGSATTAAVSTAKPTATGTATAAESAELAATEAMPAAGAAEAIPATEVATIAADNDDPIDQTASCSEDMALIAQPSAMLDLGLLAPCRPDQRVLIRHAGLVVTARTSAAGTLIGSIPALQSPAEVTLAFADGSSVTETVAITGLDQFDRFAVQWAGDDTFNLYTADVDATTPASEAGNFLTQAGDGTVDRPLLAEIYTWPAGTPALANKVALSVEAEVTAATCGREIMGETLQLVSGRLTVRDLSFAMPGCDAIGDLVIMPDPVAPEQLASN